MKIFQLKLYFLFYKCQQQKERQLLNMQIWTNKCNKMLLIVLTSPSKNSTSKRILPPTSKRSSTRNTILHGIVLLAGTLAPMSPMKPNISSIFIWVRSQSYSLSQADHMIIIISSHHLLIYLITKNLFKRRNSSLSAKPG